ncbi:MAG: putative phage abortive infection protein [Salegentibacter mishustinae]|nr:putative phage abortive infection protein [Salegentibacter mishustinae]
MKDYLRFQWKKVIEKYGIFGIILLIAAIFSIISGIVISFIFFTTTYQSINLISKGQKIDIDLTGMIGDFIGGVIGTIWSFAGVILFFLALRLQSRELSLQIDELKSTRQVFSTQQFESTFFNLLKTQNDIRQSIELRKSTYNEAGDKVTKVFKANIAFEEIRRYMHELKRLLDQNISRLEKGLSEESDWSEKQKEIYRKRFFNTYSISFSDIQKEPIIKSKIVYKRTFQRYHDQLGHYFRNLYHILLYIDENEEEELGIHHWKELTENQTTMYINGKDMTASRIKRRYFKYSQFIQAQMSEPELLLAFYNTLFFKKFRRLVEKYHLIENINTNNFIYKNDCDQEHFENFDMNISGDKKTLNEIFSIKANT